MPITQERGLAQFNITHGRRRTVGSGTFDVLHKSIILRRWDYLLLSFIYGITMIAMYSCSSVYHALRPNNGKKVMRMIDHSMIYPMIAGTITPFALLVIKPVKPVLGWVIFAVAWVVVATMIPLTLTIFEKTKGIDVVMYLALGWLIIISIKP